MLDLWDAIEYRLERNALAALLRPVPQEMQAGLVVNESAADAWRVILSIWVGVDRVKEVTSACMDYRHICFPQHG